MRAIRPPSYWLPRLRYVTRRFVFVRNDVFLSVVYCVVYVCITLLLLLSCSTAV